MAPARKYTRRSLQKLSIEIAPEAEDAILELLAQVFGQPASVYSDLERGTTVASVYARSISRQQREAVANGVSAIRACGIAVGSGRIRVQRIRRENWAESWKRHFKPMEISSRLLVLPSWSKRKPRRGQAAVILDPGLSFGTGHHPTTAFCLEQIAVLRDGSRPQSLLDIGCGSGILSIAAAKLGYATVHAFDFDPDAVRVAKENAARNHVRIDISQQDLTKLPKRARRPFDLVCANLIYDLLIEERARIVNRVGTGGTLVLAGILREQFPKVQQCYESAGLTLVATREGGEWRSGAFRFRG